MGSEVSFRLVVHETAVDDLVEMLLKWFELKKGLGWRCLRVRVVIEAVGCGCAQRV